MSLSESPGASQERVRLVGGGLWHCSFNFRIGGERERERETGERKADRM